MAKLADIDSGIRTIGKIGAVGAVAIVILLVVIMGGQFLKDVLFPTPPAPPAEKFGTLPQVSFPGQTSRDLTYTLSTLTGDLPNDFPDRMKVYKVSQPEESLAALNDARETVGAVGYDDGESKINDTSYSWINPEDGSTIQYNIISKNFKISSGFLSQTLSPLEGFIASEDAAYTTTVEFLQSMSENINFIDSEKTKLTFWKNEGGTLVALPNKNGSELVRVDLFQKDLNKLPVYYPGLTLSMMYFYYRTIEGYPRIADASYTNTIPGDSTEYPIITAAQAYEDLKNGDAYVIYNGESDSVDITDVARGYYVGPDQLYFLPIIVFTGNGFTAYVNALPR